MCAVHSHLISAGSNYLNPFVHTFLGYLIVLGFEEDAHLILFFHTYTQTSKIQPTSSKGVVLSAGQVPPATSIGIHYGQSDRMGVAFSGSKPPTADVTMLTQYCRPLHW